MKKTPMQQVKAQFGSKSGIVDAILTAIDDSSPETRAKLMRVSNQRLLRHHHLTARMQKEFGGKGALVAAICKAKFGASAVPAAYKDKLAAESAWKLMDLYRQFADK